ncbi:MAG TPA: TonB family protein, partial [Caulobacteraceae bacterium]
MMMALRNSRSEYALINALEGRHGPRKPPRGVAVAIGASVLFHLGLFTYLYVQKVTVTPAAEPPDRVISLGQVRLTPPMPLPPRQVTPRRTIVTHPVVPNPTLTPPTEVVVPATHPTLLTDSQPPLFTTDVTPPLTPPTRLIVDPKWLSQPSAAEMSRYYPERAIDQGLTGQATLFCSVVASGKLADCRVIDQTPANAGFGEAALKLANFFRMSPRTVDGKPVDGGLTRISIAFKL